MIYVLISLFGLAYVARVISVGHARLGVLESSTPEDQWHGLHLHKHLPSFDRMLWHPGFWLKWTVADWRDYAERKQ